VGADPRPAPPPRPAGVATGAFALWRDRLLPLALIAAAVTVPMLVLVEAVRHWLGGVEGFWRAVVLGSVGLAVFAFGEALCAGLAEQVLAEERRPAGATARSLPGLLARMPLLRLAVLALIVGFAVGLASAAAVVGGLVVFAWIALSCTVGSVERRTVPDAIRTSARLVRGRFWPVLPLTTAGLVLGALVEALGAYLYEHDVPLGWLLAAEGTAEAVAISLTSAMLMVLYQQLRRDRSDSDRAPGDV